MNMEMTDVIKAQEENMPSPLFTIVLAGYQTEPYIHKALESISQQTYTDFEAICYVEQSTYNSLAI